MKNMIKRAFLIHGWEGYPEEGWRPWLRKKLEERDFKVFVPAMPDTSNPKMKTWVSYLDKLVGLPDRQTYLIGHSLGAIAILRYLETLTDGQIIGGALFVAGFGKDLDYEGYKGVLKNFFSTPINWRRIRGYCNQFISIHSDDDRWVSLKNSDLFREKLGAKTIIAHHMKHFSGVDGINELPIVLEELLKIAK